MKLENIKTGNVEGKISVMQLAKEGRRVANYTSGVWLEDSSPSWNWDRLDYGIIIDQPSQDHLWFTAIAGRVQDGPYEDESSARERAKSYGGEVVSYVRSDLVMVHA